VPINVDNRGAVYVEFVMAFIPIFIMFLAVCQLTLVAAAKLVVSHAATVAVRAAIVILPDTNDIYAGAPTGVLSSGTPTQPARATLLSWFGVGTPNALPSNIVDQLEARHQKRPQRGARMGPIRLAAEVPLMAIAPNQSTTSTSSSSLERNFVTSSGSQLGFASAYTAAATAVTVHTNESSEDLAAEPIAPTAAVTVRVTYLYYCGVPIIRALMCHTATSLFSDKTSARAALAKRLARSASPLALARLLSEPAHYAILTAQATLPNQGSNARLTEGPQ
jgi:Flp pilus assembly protein TadG